MATKFRGVQDGRRELLCLTCRRATVIQNDSLSGMSVYCHALGDGIGSVKLSSLATQCSSYDDKRIPDKYELEKIAWRINSDTKTGQIGFISPKKWREMNPDGTDDF